MSNAPTPAEPAELGALRGRLGVWGLLFGVLAFNAPLAIVVGFIPVVIGIGNGIGAPVALLVAMAIMALFAVGFTTMGSRMENPGAFYSYITAGLGRPAGLGGSCLALYFYYFMLIGSYAFGGITDDGNSCSSTESALKTSQQIRTAYGNC